MGRGDLVLIRQVPFFVPSHDAFHIPIGRERDPESGFGRLMVEVGPSFGPSGAEGGDRHRELRVDAVLLDDLHGMFDAVGRTIGDRVASRDASPSRIGAVVDYFSRSRE